MPNELKSCRDRLIELLDSYYEDENLAGAVCYFTENESKALADYLLANGVIVPPCKVKDTVYEIQLERGRVQAYEVITVKYNGHFWYMLWKLKDGEGIYGNLEGFVDSELGRTVFLTKEEAEKALKEHEGNG